MRVRGRRVVLLIAGALPLLAEDDTSAVNNNDSPAQRHLPPTPTPTPIPQEQDAPVTEVARAAEVLHDETLSLLPLNLLQIESEFGKEDEGSLSDGSPEINTATTADDRITEGEEEAVDNSFKEPPDGEVEEGTEGGDSVKSDDTSSGINNEQEQDQLKADVGGGEEVETVSAGSANSVVDAEETVNEESVLQTENKAELGTEENLEHINGTNSQDEPSKDESTTSSPDSEINEELTEEPEVVAEEAVNVDTEPATLAEEAPVNVQQQPTSEPQVDKIDDDEDGSISNRVAVDYASKSAGALVLEKSSSFQGTSNLLNGDRDRYAISPCAEKKFVVLSLSEDILVKQVKLANYELYSSRVKDFQIQISQTMGNWVDLGSYTASPASGVQTFDLREPAWGRYLKFKFTSHYGDEFYCTLSQIMVHGSTMVQGFHEHLQESNEEEEEEETVADVSEEEQDNQKAVAEETLEVAARDSDATTEEESIHKLTTGEGDVTTDCESHGEEVEHAVAITTSTDVEDGTALESKETAHVGVSNENSSEKHDASDPEKESEQSEMAREEEEDDENIAKMSSRKHRNFSTALPAASIGLSSNVFTTIIGRLEPLDLKSLDRWNAPKLPDSNQLHDILAKATHSTKALKKALKDPAILDNLQLWTESSISGQFPPEAFGSAAIGPREQTLTEKLAAYLQDSGGKEIKMHAGKEESVAEPDEVSAAGEKEENTNDNDDEDTRGENVEEEQPVAKIDAPGTDSYETLHDTDLALANLLDKLPSIECLKQLDFATFKEKALAARKGGHGPGGHAAAGSPAEPIFKMLTDQIKVLQSNLSVHDQFTKEAVQCYQRVLLDVVVELQTMRMDHESRLSKLEQDLEETKTVRWIFVLYQLVMGLPNWASLLVATFFTTFVSPATVTKPLDVVQGFLEKYVSKDEHVILSWTITACIMILCCVTTLSLCHRLLSVVKSYKNGPSAESDQRSNKDPTEEDSCRFSVLNAEGKVVSVSTKPLVETSRADADDTKDPPSESASTEEEESVSPAETHAGESFKEICSADIPTLSGEGTSLMEAPGSLGADNESETNMSGAQSRMGQTISGTTESNAPESVLPVVNNPAIATEAESKLPATVPGLPDANSYQNDRGQESGLRTPEVDTTEFENLVAPFPDAVNKGPISPSSVAKVSEFAGGTNGQSEPPKESSSLEQDDTRQEGLDDEADADSDLKRKRSSSM